MCPDERDNAGDTFAYDPETSNELAAMREHCGTLKPTSDICPDGRRNAGDRYFYDPDDTSKSDAIARTCGPVSTWESGVKYDSLTGAKTLAAWTSTFDYEMDRYADEAAELWVACEDDVLTSFVYLAGEFVAASVYTDRIPVAYRFGSSPLIEQGWHSEPSNRFAVLPLGMRSEFVAGLRSSGQLVFRAWNYDGRIIGTIEFDLTGVDADVEPVLQECGW